MYSIVWICQIQYICICTMGQDKIYESIRQLMCLFYEKNSSKNILDWNLNVLIHYDQSYKYLLTLNNCRHSYCLFYSFTVINKTHYPSDSLLSCCNLKQWVTINLIPSRNMKLWVHLCMLDRLPELLELRVCQSNNITIATAT